MAYFGNQPEQSNYITDYFNGDNSTTAFTLSRAPVAPASILVHISGVKQHSSTYGVAGTTLTFSEAPPTGTDNIEVLHLGIQPESSTLPSYRTITETTSTAGQTTFTPASYIVGFMDVYRNGVKLGASDFTATNGTTVVLADQCAAGELIRFESFSITSFNNAIPNTAGAVGDSLISSVSASKVSGTLSNSIMPTGSVLQVVQAVKTDTFSSSSSSWTDITGLSVSITPSSASSKVLVMYSIVTSVNTSQFPILRILRNSTDIASGDTSGNRQSGTTSAWAGGGINHTHVQSTQYLDSPSTTSATTYKAQIISTESQAHYINRNTRDNDAYYEPRTISSITAMEIAG